MQTNLDLTSSFGLPPPSMEQVPSQEASTASVLASTPDTSETATADLDGGTPSADAWCHNGVWYAN